MADEKPRTIEEYIQAAPSEGQGHLRKIFTIFKSVADKVEGAKSVMKWNTPFFVEPRFLFAFSSFKAHLGISPGEVAMEHFRNKVAPYKTTKYMIQIRYNQEINEDLIHEIAQYCAKIVSEREDDSFW